MKMTFQEVADRFEAVLSGTLSREDADRWAWHAMQAGDRNDLDFAPPSDEQRIWRGLTYLCGIDLPGEATGSYLHSDDDIRAAYGQISGAPLA